MRHVDTYKKWKKLLNLVTRNQKLFVIVGLSRYSSFYFFFLEMNIQQGLRWQKWASEKLRKAWKVTYIPNQL